MPTFQMRPGKHIKVVVHYPFLFETLTLDPSPAQALQGSDQGAGLINAAIPNLKGLQASTRTAFYALDQQTQTVPSRLQAAAGASAAVIQVVDMLNDLTTRLQQIADSAQALPAELRDFDDQVAILYTQLKEIQSAVPRTADKNGRPLRAQGLPGWMKDYDPWTSYPQWRGLLLYELNDTTFNPPNAQSPDPEVPEDILQQAQNLGATMPKPGSSPGGSSPSLSPGSNALSDFEARASAVQTAVASLADVTLRQQYQSILDDDVALEQFYANSLAPAATALAKVAADLQTYEGNIDYWTGSAEQTGITCCNLLELGDISDPISPDKADKKLAPFKALGRQIAYTLNAQNQIVVSALSVPTPAQKTAILAITALYADPSLEVSVGAFVSWLPNRSFSNYTDIKQTTSGNPSPVDVKISETTSRPEVLPFAAANYRIGRDFVMPGQRRGAVYGTLAFALNPYNQLPEFGAGFSLSWRSFMFSPLYHLGHGIHLTQGEMVGEIWCVYGAASGSIPPPCGSPPPAPSTKTYWTGRFAIGISIRVPTTFTGAPPSGASGSGH